MAKFPTCDRELERNKELGELGHSCNPSTKKVKDGGYLSLRLAWSRDSVSEQTSLGNEGQRAVEVLIQ